MVPVARELIASVVADVDARLRAAGTADRAEHEKAYLKSDLEFYGASVPAVRKVARAVRAELGDIGHDELVATVEELWQRPVHETRMFAIELLGLYGSELTADDAPLFESMLREAKTWALVDGLAASVVGGVVERDARFGKVLDRWSVDPDFWVRRAALLALLVPLRAGRGDWDRFCRYADAMLEEKEFFIRKAVGWVLRDTARKRPEMVRDWILPRATRASGVTLREVIKPLAPEDRDAVLAASGRSRSST